MPQPAMQMTANEPDHIDQFPISEDSIRNRVCEIGRQIIEDVQRDAGPDGTIDLTVMPVLSGARARVRGVTRTWACFRRIRSRKVWIGCVAGAVDWLNDLDARRAYGLSPNIAPESLRNGYFSSGQG